MRLISAATISVLSMTVIAFAGDRPPRHAGASEDARHERSEPIIRPPASIPSRSYRTASPSSTDRHVAEFLRWKEQHANRSR
jgi:hypothetical protein